MLIVTNQSQTETHRIYYYHIVELKEYGCWMIVGLAKDTLKSNELVKLALYSDYKQAIQVFAEMDYKCNDLIYYKAHEPYYIMPENMINGQEAPIELPYGDMLILIDGEQYMCLLGNGNVIKDHTVIIGNNTRIEEPYVILG